MLTSISKDCFDMFESMNKAKDRLCLFSLKKVYGKVYTIIQRRSHDKRDI